jgi:CBS domain containing-hemolysin-like protein
MRAFMTVTRPLLIALNHAANWCLRRIGVTPVDDVDSGQDPDALRHLVEHSATVGTLDQRNYRNLASALDLERLAVGDIVSRTAQLSSVSADADAEGIQSQARATHHQRILVRGDGHAIVGVVHVRDSLGARRGATAHELMRPVLRLPVDVKVYRALQTMRQTRNHLAIVIEDGETIGLITLTDVLQRLLPDAQSAA